MIPLLRVRVLFSALLLALAATLAGAQTYTSVVIFGDSLSDTGNVKHLTQAQFFIPIPGPGLSNYTLGRFTDGGDTLPMAKLYTGVWIEQLAASLANKPAIKNSLDGGTNYAYGYATTGTGTSVLNLTTGISVTVNNMGQQVADYLATKPAISNKTLYVVWGGANDLLSATTPAAISAAATQEISVVQTLIAAGATDFIVPNLPPLGLIPRLNMNVAAAAQATAAATAFNQVLAAGLGGLPAANTGKTLHLYPLDVFTLLNSVVANPAANGLTNVTASSQGQITVNPDTFLFWDDLHPTTTGHHLISVAASTHDRARLHDIDGADDLGRQHGLRNSRHLHRSCCLALRPADRSRYLPRWIDQPRHRDARRDLAGERLERDADCLHAGRRSAYDHRQLRRLRRLRSVDLRGAYADRYGGQLQFGCQPDLGHHRPGLHRNLHHQRNADGDLRRDRQPRLRHASRAYLVQLRPGLPRLYLGQFRGANLHADDRNHQHLRSARAAASGIAGGPRVSSPPSRFCRLPAV